MKVYGETPTILSDCLAPSGKSSARCQLCGQRLPKAGQWGWDDGGPLCVPDKPRTRPNCLREWIRTGRGNARNEGRYSNR